MNWAYPNFVARYNILRYNTVQCSAVPLIYFMYQWMQVANKTGLSSLSIFQETRWLVCSLLKSVSLALKVTVKCCKSNYLRWSVYRRNINLSLMAAGDYILRPLSAVLRCSDRCMKRCTFLSFNTGQALISLHTPWYGKWLLCIYRYSRGIKKA